MQDKSRLDVATGELELWFETRADTILDLHPGDSLNMGLRVTDWDTTHVHFYHLDV